MSSKIAKQHAPRQRTAAWRITLGGSIAFAIGTAFAFWFLQQFLAHEIQNRADAWLTGELGVLADVAERTPANQLHNTVVREVAELASREVPHDETGTGPMSRAVFFLQTSATGELKLHTGAASGPVAVQAVLQDRHNPELPADVAIPGFRVPFRVAEARLTNGDRIFLALSSAHEQNVLHRLRVDFGVLWFLIIALGSLIVFVSTRRMLHRVQVITETAETIGRTNLSSRVPMTQSNDEISQLSSTLNRMLDRVENSVQQLHAMSDSLAHDLRSPLTSLRAKLELALVGEEQERRDVALGQCLEELDRLSALLSTSLDVSEASADALRMRKEDLDLDEVLQTLAGLYEPAFAHAGLALVVRSTGPAHVLADPTLIQRTLSNLFDNELKHLGPGHTVTMALTQPGGHVHLAIDDDGEGFSPELIPNIFERYAKGPHSAGYGLGLAFVSAVVRSHEGSVVAKNAPKGGAHIEITLPQARARQSALSV